MICSCPISAALTAIVTNACKEDTGQIQKVLFQRKFSTGTTLNKFTIGTTNPNIAGTWTTVTGAVDGTKVVVSPYIQAPETEPGADDNTSAAEFYPIPVRAFFVGDKGFGGFENPDKNMVSFEFPPNWSDQLHVVSPASGFAPLTDIG